MLVSTKSLSLMAFRACRQDELFDGQRLGDQPLKPLPGLFFTAFGERDLDRGMLRQVDRGLGDEDAMFVNCGDGMRHEKSSGKLYT